MLDAYMWGKVNRISPEAPVPIVSVTSNENRLGGAANVARNLGALGAHSILCSVVGDDEKATIFEDLLKNEGLSSSGILRSSKRKTTIKTRIIAGSQHTLRVDEEITTPLDNELETEFIASTKKIIQSQKVDVLIFEDYDKGVLTQKVIEEVTAFANEQNIPVLVDPKYRNFHHYSNVTLFKPNFKELVEGMKVDIDKKDIGALQKAAQKFLSEKNIRYVMVTLSELGVLICSKDETLHIPARIRQIADVSGAGDTVISVASLCLASGMSMHDIANISNVAGGLVCEHTGVVPIDKLQLVGEINK